jgi:2-polyprenyl-3-methyl-5-hydroxy-6-metoxy-1,4-benzoquinol methylase
MDRSRQWGRHLEEIKQDHVNRYRFAKDYVSGRVLDAACGCGYGSKLLLEKASDVVGVDASQEAIDWANEYFSGPSYIKGRIEEAPWTGEFEAVVSLETLEHLPNPEEALKAFRRCAKRLIASVPNELLYPFDARAFANDSSPHFRHYTPDEFTALLEGAGFKVLERYCQASKHQPEVVPGMAGRFMVFVCE